MIDRQNAQDASYQDIRPSSASWDRPAFTVTRGQVVAGLAVVGMLVGGAMVLRSAGKGTSLKSPVATADMVPGKPEALSPVRDVAPGVTPVTVINADGGCVESERLVHEADRMVTRNKTIPCPETGEAALPPPPAPVPARAPAPRQGSLKDTSVQQEAPYMQPRPRLSVDELNAIANEAARRPYTHDRRYRTSEPEVFRSGVYVGRIPYGRGWSFGHWRRNSFYYDPYDNDFKRDTYHYDRKDSYGKRKYKYRKRDDRKEYRHEHKRDRDVVKSYRSDPDRGTVGRPGNDGFERRKRSSSSLDSGRNYRTITRGEKRGNRKGHRNRDR